MGVLGRLKRVQQLESVEHGVVYASLIGGLALVEPSKPGVKRRVAYRCAIAGVTVWSVWVSLRSTKDRGAIGEVSRASLAAGAGGVALGLAQAGEALDGRIHNKLERAGVRKPRLVLAAAQTALALGAWWVDRKFDRQADEFPFDFDDDAATTNLTELPDPLRELATALLGGTELCGAPELRAQLALAKLVSVADEEADPDTEFWPNIDFEVPAELPLAVPARATFAVIGRYRALGDRSFDLSLQIADGRLQSMCVTEGQDWLAEELDAWSEGEVGLSDLGAWPAPGQLTLLIDSPTGLRFLREP